jgi:hypothetical protein
MPRFLSLLPLAVAGLVRAAEPSADAIAFFETKVHPILSQRCLECHSHEKKIKGGLALDSRAAWQSGGDSGPVIMPGEMEKSLLIKAVRYTDEDLQMPPKEKLSAGEIAILEQWVGQGAVDPRAGAVATKSRTIDLAEGKNFWVFQPVASPAPPRVQDTAWPLDPLDRFILAKLETSSVRPVADADRSTWLRRVSLDLTGLPPAPGDVTAFEKDGAPNAREKVVDRLLGSRSFGERWARHWLDLTGYADMMGTSNSVYAEHAWRYRDYVIAAFNADKPFDEFVREQIAGDLLPAQSTEDRAENIIATGFLMVGDIEIVNPDKARMETDHIDTQVGKVGTAFMGMTLSCVRCHDHKFDPIGVEDYYGIAGMLRSSPSSRKIPFGVWSTLNTTELPETAEQIATRTKLEAEHEEKLAALKEEQTRLTDEKKAVVAALAKLGKPAKAAAAAPATTEAEKTAPVEVTNTTTGEKSAVAAVTASTANAETKPTDTMPDPSAAERERLTKRRDELTETLKKHATSVQHAEFFRSKAPKAFAMHDGDKPADMPVYIRGNPYAPAAVVPRGAMRVASWENFPNIPAGQSGRLQLADWLADKRNPLTARVTVNRIWQKLFGEGIVRSVDYFGARGETPSHPELLDHLATRFMKDGWSQKQFIRALVLSRAYRLGSGNDPVAMKVDPENRMFWRMNRQRLDAEALRDALLAVSGELKLGGGGPALVLENIENTGGLVQKGVNPPNYTHKVPRPEEEFTRTIYLPVLRNGYAAADRTRAFFDFVNPAQIAGQRAQTVVPTQALFLLNNDLLRKRAGTLAKNVIAAHPDRDGRLAELWRRVFSRALTAAERDDASAFLDKLDPLLKNRATAESVAWQELCHGLLASNEFIYRL